MALSSIMSSKGQVTVPQEIRLRLGLKEGDRVEFVAQGDQTLIRPVRKEENPFAEFVGIIDAFPGGLPEINCWLRDLRGKDPEPK